MGGETTSIMYQNPVEEGYSGMRGETTTMMYQNPVEEELGRDAWRDYNYDVPINDGPPPPKHMLYHQMQRHPTAGAQHGEVAPAGA